MTATPGAVGTELDDLEVVALQLIADPRGYAERVVAQLLERLATPAVPATTNPSVPTTHPGE